MLSATYRPQAEETITAAMIVYLVARGARLSAFKEGSRILTLLRAAALEIAKSEATFSAYHQAGILEACYLAFGFEKQPGRRATGQVRLYNTGHTENLPIPPFEIRLFGLRYQTESEPPILPAGADYIDINIAAVEPGTGHNIEAGQIDTDRGRGTVVPADIPFQRITNLQPIAQGTDQESVASRAVRFRDMIRNLGRSTLSGIESHVKSIPGVVDATVQENRHPLTGEEETGWINVFVTDGTSSPSAEFLAEVKRVVDGDADDVTRYPGLRAGGTRSYVSPIFVQAVTVRLQLDVLQSATVSDSSVSEAVATAVQEYVNRLRPGQDVLLQQIRAAALHADPTAIVRATILEPTADVVVPPSYFPKIGGSAGGTIEVTAVNRVVFP